MKVTDISLYEEKPILTTRAEILVQSIGVLFDTAPGEVMGDDEFGSTFENFVWDLSISNSQISDYVRRIIYNNINIASYFTITVNTNICYGTAGDIILVTIDVVDNETHEAYANTYKIS